MGFIGVDCSSGTCDGCRGVIGFNFESIHVDVTESVGSVNLTLVRLIGTDGDVDVWVNAIAGNATLGADFGGAWPAQVLM